MASRKSLEEAVKSGDRREALIAIRDFLANELEGNRCKACAMSQLRTGDTAALVLRLTKVLEELEAIPNPEEQEVSVLDELLIRRAHKAAGGASGASGAKDSPQSGEPGTKHGQRRQGGRRTGSERGSAS